MAWRASQGINARELRRQKNTETIIQKTAQMLPASVSETQVDEDWINQFFNQCEDIGNEEMQIVWARLLAGEIAQPGTYSPRTMALVRLLRKSDADLFRRFCNYIWTMEGERPFHIYTGETDKLLASKGLHFDEFLQLENLGLINNEPLLAHLPSKDREEISYIGDTYVLNYVSPPMAPTNALKIRSLTEICAEVASLCNKEPDEDYRALIIQDLAKRGLYNPLEAESLARTDIEGETSNPE